MSLNVHWTIRFHDPNGLFLLEVSTLTYPIPRQGELINFGKASTYRVRTVFYETQFKTINIQLGMYPPEH